MPIDEVGYDHAAYRMTYISIRVGLSMFPGFMPIFPITPLFFGDRSLCFYGCQAFCRRLMLLPESFLDSVSLVEVSAWLML